MHHSRQDSKCRTNCGAWTGMKNSLMGTPGEIDPMTYLTMSGHSTIELHPVPSWPIVDSIFQHHWIEDIVNQRVKRRHLSLNLKK